MSRILACVAVALCLLAGARAPAAQGVGKNEHWVGTWATAVVARPPQAQAPPGQTPDQASALNFNNQTLRQIVHVSLGGDAVRVVLSNAFGTAPLSIGAARLALRDKGAAIVSKSDRVLTFGASPVTTIPAGAVVFSDPVSLTIPPLADLAIDLYLPGDTAAAKSSLTTHAGALQTNYVSLPGNHAGALEMPVLRTTGNWFFLARVEVTTPAQAGAIVALGDSITDGTRSTPDTNNRWPDHLARRLAAQNVRMGVLNVGIGGNQMLSDYSPGASALARLDRDVLAQTGATYVILMEGINDIRRWHDVGRAAPPTASDLIFGHGQVIARAHARGLTIYGATLTPCDGNSFCTPEMEATRQALNAWIRTGRVYDGVIDFDAVVRDQDQLAKLQPRYDSGDHIHPNDAGYLAMANGIDLELFKASQARAVTTP